MASRVLDVAPEPGKEVCDFCSEPKVVKDYPAISFDVDHIPRGDGTKIDLVRVNDWCACQDCAFLIDNEDWEKLAARAAESFADKYRVPVDIKFIRNMHQKFRENRIRLV